MVWNFDPSGRARKTMEGASTPEICGLKKEVCGDPFPVLKRVPL
jgi:hypothetical protein